MLFAVVDYIKYKLQKGVYSPKSIHEYGAVLAERSLLTMLEKCEPGDILFVHTADSILSWAVMYYTGPTIWSHTAMFGKDGYLYDCTTQGVMEHHISDYFNGKSYIAVIALGSKISENKGKKMMLRGEQIIGSKFNWKGIFFFWLAIISGNCEDFRMCCVADILILLSSLMVIFYEIPIIRYIFLNFSALYLFVVIFSRMRMKISKRKCIENQAIDEIKKEYVVGENIIHDLIELSLDDLKKYFEAFENDFADIPGVVSSVCNNIASKLTKINEYDKAEMLYKKALKQCKDSTPKEKMDIAGILNNLAGVYVEKKQYDKAKETMGKAKIYIEDIETDEAKALYDRLNNNLNILDRKIVKEF